MGEVLRYLKYYKKESILAPLLKFLEAAFELTVPLVIAAIIDNGIANGDKGYTVKACCLLAAFAVFGLLIAAIAQYFSAKAATGFAGRIRSVLFKHVNSLSFSELEGIGTSTLINRITSDVNQVQNGVNLVLRLALRSPFVVFGAMAMAFTVDPKSALIFVATIPALAVVVVLLMLVCIPLYKKVQLNLDKALRITHDNLTGVRVVRAFCNQENEIDEFNFANVALSKTQKFVGGISAIMNPATYVVVNLAIIWLINVGAIRVDAGIISQGAVVALYNYMSQILVELIKLANLIININKFLASTKRIAEILNTKSSMSFAENEVDPIENTPAVEFTNVSFRYKGAAENSLDNICLNAEKGSTVGIIGGTGSGKSSLVNLIPRFYDTESGEVFVNGINVKDYPAEQLREMIGVVPQKSVLFKGTVRSNLLMSNHNATEMDMIEALKAAQAYDFLFNYKNGLDTEVSEGGKNFSGGQRQRLTVARALVRHPQILILDDSSSALDFATEANLRAAIKKLDFNPTVFVVSQRASTVSAADTILVLDDGALVGCGTHNELLESCEVYKEIYDSQIQRTSIEEVQNEE